MQKIILAGRTGKYVTFKEVEINGNKATQALFSVFVNGFGKDSEPTIYTCIYSKSNKTMDSLFVKKGTYTKKDGTVGYEYYSRSVVIDGTLSIKMKAQQLPVFGLEGEYEEVIAPYITVFVNSIDFMDASPKNENESTSDKTSDERMAHREKIKKMKEEAISKEDDKKEKKEYTNMFG